jgi:hypothetical protein
MAENEGPIVVRNYATCVCVCVFFLLLVTQSFYKENVKCLIFIIDRHHVQYVHCCDGVESTVKVGLLSHS